MGKQLKKSVRRMISAMMVIAVTMTGCGSDDGAGGMARVSLGFGGYTTAQKVWNLILPSAYASVSDLKMCFKRLRLKTEDVDSIDPALDDDNVDFDLGEVTVSSAGSSLGAITVPHGTYRRIEFDLEDHCASGLSLNLTNSNGVYTTAARITVRFYGTFVVNDDTSLNLDAQTILNALNTYNGATPLRDVVEASGGTY